MPTFYTDGSGWAKTKFGGCAYVRILPSTQQILRSFSRPYSNTTTNRMELLAVIHALESLRKPSAITIYLDSMYVKKVATILARSNVSDKLANKDLWLRYRSVARQHRITFIHVRGHQGNRFNEVADKLAGRAYQEAKTNPKPEYEDNKTGVPGSTPVGSLFG